MNKIPTVGIMMPEMFDPYQAKVWAGISSRIKELGLRQFCFVGGAFDFNENKHKFRNQIYTLINSQKIDMLLLFSGPLSVSSGPNAIGEFLSTLEDIPVVSIGVEIQNIASVLVDNHTGMYQLVDHIINEHNAQRIGFIKGPDANDEAKARYKAYCEALSDNNITYDEKLIIQGNFHPDDGKTAVQKLILDENVEIDSLIASDDSSILYALSELQKHNINCPEDILIGGFDDIELSEYNTPSLTTVRQPLYELGAKSVETVYNLYNKISEKKSLLIPTELVIRNSCGCIQGHSENESIESKHIFIEEIFKQLCIRYRENGDSHLLLLEAMYQTIKDVNISKLGNVFESLLQQSKTKGISVSYWNRIINEIYTEFASTRLTEIERKNLLFLQSQSGILLYKLQAKIWAQFAISQNEYFEELQRYDDNLLLCFDEVNLKRTLTMGLPYFGVDFLLIALFNEDPKTSKVYYCQTDKELENTTFISTDLYPAKLDTNENSVTVHPIMHQQVPIGFVLTSMKDFSATTVEFIAEKISGALARIKLVEKINEHSKELERVVDERTLQLKAANRQLKELSFKDQLSGLYNRRFLNSMIIPDTKRFQRTMIHNMTQSERRAKDHDSYAIMIIDIDHFKAINDTYGHKAGDLVIQQISWILKDAVRENDYVIRFGGEEFLIILKDFKSAHLAEKADAIREKIAIFNFEIGKSHPIKRSCSMGCATFPFCYEYPSLLEFNETINMADTALYNAKETGRNRAVHIQLNPEEVTDAAMAQEVVKDVKKGIRNKQLIFTTLNP